MAVSRDSFVRTFASYSGRNVLVTQQAALAYGLPDPVSRTDAERLYNAFPQGSDKIAIGQTITRLFPSAGAPFAPAEAGVGGLSTTTIVLLVILGIVLLRGR